MVCFQNHQGQIVTIELVEDGYSMRIIEQDNEVVELYREEDGGLCTGGAIDVVEWCMEWGLDKEDNTKSKLKM